jgi:GH3 auxin-responsive promoter
VPARRRTAVRRRLQNATLGEAMWPRLAVLSCWADGAACDAIPSLQRYLPHARIQAKGLLATEGVVSLPLTLEDSTGSVAAVAGHFLEFLDLEHPTAAPVLAHDLQHGAVYAPIISTGGGFYRYKLGDAVRCTGFHMRAPVLRFEGRIDQVSDLCGEKLNPRMVAQALGYAEHATGSRLDFALLAPAAGDPPRYRLYAEGVDVATLQSVCDAVERALCDSHGYRYARALGQLSGIEGVPVRDGAVRYLRARTDAGQRAGEIKPAHLDSRLDWSLVFGTAQCETRSPAEVTR